MIELSIQSTNVQTRQAARSTVISYVKNYNLKKKLPRVLDMFTAQLGYEHEFGRLSAAEVQYLLYPLLPAEDSQVMMMVMRMIMMRVRRRKRMYWGKPTVSYSRSNSFCILFP